jgi:hypothetical protein
MKSSVIEGTVKMIEDPIDTFGVFEKRDNHFDYLTEVLQKLEGKKVRITIEKIK